MAIAYTGKGQTPKSGRIPTPVSMDPLYRYSKENSRTLDSLRNSGTLRASIPNCMETHDPLDQEAQDRQDRTDRLRDDAVDAFDAECKRLELLSLNGTREEVDAIMRTGRRLRFARGTPVEQVTKEMQDLTDQLRAIATLRQH